MLLFMLLWMLMMVLVLVVDVVYGVITACFDGDVVHYVCYFDVNVDGGVGVVVFVVFDSFGVIVDVVVVADVVGDIDVVVDDVLLFLMLTF